MFRANGSLLVVRYPCGRNKFHPYKMKRAYGSYLQISEGSYILQYMDFNQLEMTK
jgi:hypothetical protein